MSGKWQRCFIVKDEDTTEYINNLVKLKLIKNLSGFVQDARGLQHTAIKVPSVYYMYMYCFLTTGC